MARRRIEVDYVVNNLSPKVLDKMAMDAYEMSKNMDKAAKQANASFDKFYSGLHKYNAGMNKINRGIAVAMGASAYSVYRFTKDSISHFAELEKQHAKTMGAMANDYKRTNAEQQRFIKDQEKLKDMAIKLGTLGPTSKGALFNPAQVAYSQTSMVKAGVKPNDILGTKLVPQVLKFAGGNDIPIDTATDYAINLSKMYNIPINQIGSMLDKVTRAADISTVDVPDIFESLKYAGGITAGLDRSLEEILGMIAVMGNAGLKGTMSGTGIQAFFTRILSPVGKTEKALQTAPSEYSRNILEAFVAEATDANGNFKDMPSITEKLDEAMNSLNDKEQAWFSHKLFGLFQMKAAYTLGNQGGDILASTIEDIKNNSSGTNERKWDIMLGTSYGKQAAFGNMVEGVKTDVGDRLSDLTNAVFDELFNLLSSQGDYQVDFNKLRDALQQSADLMAEKYGETIGDFVSGTGGVMLNGTRIAGALEPIFEGLGAAGVNILGGNVIKGLDALSESITRTNDRIDELPPELQTLTDGFKGIILAIAPLAAINFSAKVIENFATIYKYTLGKMIGKPKTETINTMTAKVGSSVINADLMNVTANVVNVYGGRLNTGINGTPKPGGDIVPYGPRSGGSGPRGVINYGNGPGASSSLGGYIMGSGGKKIRRTSKALGSGYVYTRGGKLVADWGNGIPPEVETPTPTVSSPEAVIAKASKGFAITATEKAMLEQYGIDMNIISSFEKNWGSYHSTFENSSQESKDKMIFGGGPKHDIYMEQRQKYIDAQTRVAINKKALQEYQDRYARFNSGDISAGTPRMISVKRGGGIPVGGVGQLTKDELNILNYEANLNKRIEKFNKKWNGYVEPAGGLDMSGGLASKEQLRYREYLKESAGIEHGKMFLNNSTYKEEMAKINAKINPTPTRSMIYTSGPGIRAERKNKTQPAPSPTAPPIVSPTRFGGKFGKSINKASIIYFISEMFGITDSALDGLGITEGTAARGAIDFARSGINMAVTAQMLSSFIDDGIFEGAGKQLIKRYGTSLIAGAKAALPAVESAIGMGATSLMVPVLLAGPVIYSQYQKNTAWEKYSSQITPGKKLYWNGSTPVVGPELSDKDLAEAGYKYGGVPYGAGSIMERMPMPSDFTSNGIMGTNMIAYQEALKAWHDKYDGVLRNEANDRNAFHDVSAVFMMQNGYPLSWASYNKNRGAFGGVSIGTNLRDQMKYLLSPRNIMDQLTGSAMPDIFNSINSNIIALQSQKPVVNVNPNVNVEVTVDQNGKVLNTKTYISDYSDYDRSIDMRLSRYGR